MAYNYDDYATLKKQIEQNNADLFKLERLTSKSCVADLPPDNNKSACFVNSLKTSGDQCSITILQCDKFYDCQNTNCNCYVNHRVYMNLAKCSVTFHKKLHQIPLLQRIGFRLKYIHEQQKGK